MSEMPPPTETVWVFHGSGAHFASGVFRLREDGLSWAEQFHLSGILTDYPLGVGVYNDAVARHRFRPSKSHHGSAQHIGGFSPDLGHVHIQDGRPA